MSGLSSKVAGDESTLIEEEQPLLPKTEQQSVGNKKDLDQYIPLLLIAIFVWAFSTFIGSNGQIQSLRGIRRDTTELHKVVKDLNMPQRGMVVVAGTDSEESCVSPHCHDGRLGASNTCIHQHLYNPVNHTTSWNPLTSPKLCPLHSLGFVDIVPMVGHAVRARFILPISPMIPLRHQKSLNGRK
ncbi:hypothetical protein C366_02519 [Cryptococcus neoformans Tu401-1]|nr:hypothetical protein C365_02663 [Cryptococcus neoformans var. grubii Bt85]OXG19663.1 hypothetical protein C366_02519 [Cryptococcus neoformans var. grubii Tu401-1]OXM79778.1 hypothetical protein C364_02482 [Cryptococcus neoformans var. grubii Bt63]